MQLFLFTNDSLLYTTDLIPENSYCSESIYSIMNI